MCSLNTVRVLYPSHSELGEGPLWHQERRSCFWIDVYGHKLFEYNFTKQICQQYDVEPFTSFIAQSTDGQLILASKTGIFYYNVDEGEKRLITNLDGLKTNYRCNDGSIDSQGRLWIGTMEMQVQGKGKLYCIDRKGGVLEKLNNLSISNGIAWSHDDKIMYHIDSLTKGVDAYLFEADSGRLIKSRTCIMIPDNMGLPDGMTIDCEGNLWVALYGGHGVAKFNPDTGDLLDFIEVPCPNVTACCFAGDDLDQLVITSAKRKMENDTLAQYPMSGNTFVVSMTVSGASEFKYLI